MRIGGLRNRPLKAAGLGTGTQIRTDVEKFADCVVDDVLGGFHLGDHASALPRQGDAGIHVTPEIKALGPFPEQDGAVGLFAFRHGQAVVCLQRPQARRPFAVQVNRAGFSGIDDGILEIVMHRAFG